MPDQFVSQHIQQFHLAIPFLIDDYSCVQVKWGCDLQSEHERYITEKFFKGTPVIVTDYPKVVHLF